MAQRELKDPFYSPSWHPLLFEAERDQWHQRGYMRYIQVFILPYSNACHST